MTWNRSQLGAIVSASARIARTEITLRAMLTAHANPFVEMDAMPRVPGVLPAGGLTAVHFTDIENAWPNLFLFSTSVLTRN